MDSVRIPPSAVMATCPRCKTRFRFRTLSEDAATASTPEPHPDTPNETPSPPSVKPSTSNRTVEHSGTDDPLPPGAVVPPMNADIPEQDNADPDNTEAEMPRAPSAVKDAPRSFAERVREAVPETGSSTPESSERDIPWERTDKYGLFGGLYQTVLRVLFSAPNFFGALSAASGPLFRPVLFYIIMGMFQTASKLTWFRTVDPAITDPQVQELLSTAAQDISVPMTLLLAPGLLVLQLLIYSGLFYLMLRLVQPERTVFAVVLRVVGYSSAPMVFSLVPFLGSLVAPVWFAVCCFIGCKYALKTGWHQVALALVPLYLIAFAVAFQLVQRLMQLG